MSRSQPTLARERDLLVAVNLLGIMAALVGLDALLGGSTGDGTERAPQRPRASDGSARAKKLVDEKEYDNQSHKYLRRPAVNERPPRGMRDDGAMPRHHGAENRVTWRHRHVLRKRHEAQAVVGHGKRFADNNLQPFRNERL